MIYDTHSTDNIKDFFSLWKSSTSGRVTSSLDMVGFFLIKEMPFTVFVKLPKSHQLPEFWEENHTQSMWILRAQHIMFLKTISILLPFTFPLCDWAPPIPATRGAGRDITQLQAQELRLSVLRAQPSGLCAVVETADPENSWKEGKTDGESQAQEHKKEGDGNSEVG